MTPLDPRVRPYLKGWWTARFPTFTTSTGITVCSADGNDVGRLVDQSNVGFHLTQTSNLPSWKVNIGKNFPAVLYNGTSNYLIRSSLVTTATEGLLIVVARAGSSGATRQIFGVGNSASATRYNTFGLNSSNQPFFEYKNTAGASSALQVRGGSTVSGSALSILVFSGNGLANGWQARLNGANETMTVVTGSNAGSWIGSIVGANQTTMGVGLHTSAFYYYNDYIAEAMLFDTLTVGTHLHYVQQLEQYLANIYGIAL